MIPPCRLLQKHRDDFKVSGGEKSRENIQQILIVGGGETYSLLSWA